MQFMCIISLLFYRTLPDLSPPLPPPLPLPLCVRTGYIGDMIKILEKKGIMPIPIFISGVEGHTVVRGKYVHLYMSCTCVSCV